MTLAPPNSESSSTRRNARGSPASEKAEHRFKEGAVLTVCGHSAVSDGRISALRGARLDDVEETHEQVSLTFTGKCLRIDLRDEAYSGPEALVLHLPGGPIIVWN